MASSIPREKPSLCPLASLVKIEVERGPGRGHFGNFIAAVRSRKVEDLNADILEGHYSAALCHLANISYRLGQEVPFNKTTKAFGDDKEANETLAAWRSTSKITVWRSMASITGLAAGSPSMPRPSRSSAIPRRTSC